MKLRTNDKKILALWRKILNKAKKIGLKGDKKKTLGSYQIREENKYYIDKNRVKLSPKEYKKLTMEERILYELDYIDSNLEGDIKVLVKKLDEYYDKYIKPKLFKYELLK